MCEWLVLNCVVGKYCIEEELGWGVCGMVYCVIDIFLEWIVVLKVFNVVVDNFVE